jgi:hypothetical protein
MKNIMFLLIGILVGVFVTYSLLNFRKKRESTTEYLELNRDILLHNNCIIKAGTQLKIDEGMPEGFTRYILYINAKSMAGTINGHPYRNYVIPYWRTSSVK